MSVLKRFGWFFAVNMLIVLMVTVVSQVLGVGNYLTAQGLDYWALAGFCLVWGMTGSFVSLAISRLAAKWMMGVQVIDPSATGGVERFLLDTVHAQARRSGIEVMPEVGVYDSPEVNAFATGPTRNRALVAVSTGLLSGMRRDEIEAVLAHEVAHVANGDMVTMTLIQGVVNAVVMFLARVLAFFASGFVKDERAQDVVRLLVTIVLQIGLGVLGSMAVAAFSRAREYRADQGGAALAGREKMIAALQRLQQQTVVAEGEAASLAAFKISGHGSGFWALLSTHPPLEDRIAALRR